LVTLALITSCGGGSSEESPVTWHEDADGDGYTTGDTRLSVAQPFGFVLEADLFNTTDLDCNDKVYFVNPGATEVCGDSYDNDCIGGDAICPVTWWKDADDDGYTTGDTLLTITQPDGFVLEATLANTTDLDCNDDVYAVNPAATEVCGDSVDNDCTGGDEICPVTWWKDADDDGYTTGDTLLTVTQPDGFVLEADLVNTTSLDCNDDVYAVNPAATEVCGDSVDNDCTGGDAVCPVTWWKDADDDGYTTGVTLLTVTQPDGFVLEADLVNTTSLDCDDISPAVNPGATEVCGDSVDNDCTGGDEICPVTWWKDADGDGYTTGDTLTALVQPAYYVPEAELFTTTDLDCNDNNPAINPGAYEVYDGVDNNCSGGIDEGYYPYYFDSDLDFFGAGSPVYLQVVTEGWSVHNTDCDDTNPDIHPSAIEIFDGVDNDCDGLVDEHFYYLDNDFDGYGAGAPVYAGGDTSRRHVLVDGDCDDGNSSINPDAVDIAFNGIDEDCNGADAPFIDAQLESCVLEATGAKRTLADFEAVVSLDCQERNIVSLDGIETLISLEELNLASNTISDITPLAGLASLSGLDIADNTISDLSPLTGLSSLEYLWLDYNNICSLTPVYHVLNLYENYTQDTSACP
jgi:hypothetical protein